jgi:hypothetical protein
MASKKALVKILSKKTIAVSSGKGGVGKTTTAVNLAVYYAKKKYRIGLIDLDPLSDIATLLDLEEPESIFKMISPPMSIRYSTTSISFSRRPSCGRPTASRFWKNFTRALSGS